MFVSLIICFFSEFSGGLKLLIAQLFKGLSKNCRCIKMQHMKPLNASPCETFVSVIKPPSSLLLFLQQQLPPMHRVLVIFDFTERCMQSVIMLLLLLLYVMEL
jgi:hypothetical protein